MNGANGETVHGPELETPEARVRRYMREIDDANESGSGMDVHAMIVKMHKECDPEVIERVAREKQLARQVLRRDQLQ